jgi:hypothetical protein
MLAQQALINVLRLPSLVRSGVHSRNRFIYIRQGSFQRAVSIHLPRIGHLRCGCWIVAGTVRRIETGCQHGHAQRTNVRVGVSRLSIWHGEALSIETFVRLCGNCHDRADRGQAG